MFVFANCDASVYEDGRRYHLNIDAIWSADDPFVKARPDLFSATPRKVNSSAVKVAKRDVEAATAAPGEKRAAKRG